MTQLIIALEIGYIEQSMAEVLVDECDKISSMLTKLIRARSE
jgi:four helix bundle protein